MVSFTAREFNRDVSAAKRAAEEAPVIVTDRGEPAFVLMSIDHYRTRVRRESGRTSQLVSMSEEAYVSDEDFLPGSVSLEVPDL